MKYRTTQKAIRSGFHTVIAVPYCGLQTLLSMEDPVAYTVRREGWGADIYDVGNGVAIVTGYAPFGKCKPSHILFQKYEMRARVVLDTTHSYVETKEALRRLIDDFVWELSGLKCHSDTVENNSVSA